MINFGTIIVAAWLVFLLYWFISALSAKRMVRNRVWWQTVIGRLLTFWVLFIIFSSKKFQLFASNLVFPTTVGFETVGTLFCVIGIALAIWARLHIGRNWGMPMSQNEDPELVTDGPYAVVRHPIYSGVLLALLGTSFVGGLPVFLFFVFFAIYFIYSATIEEQNMMRNFPTVYPEYKRRTKMLIPFIF